MAEPTLTQVFGPGATQTATVITILKADLVSTGLTASAANTAESLLGAIVLKGKDYLTQAAFDLDLAHSITIATGFNSIVQRDTGNGVFAEYRQFQFLLNAHQVDSATLDPDVL